MSTVQQVVVMSHGWGYNHTFFSPLISQCPQHERESTLFVCLEAGYFPEQAQAGLMVHQDNDWQWHPLETLHSLVLAHAGVPWVGLGHSLGFSKLLEFAVRWHTMISVHGFTHFVKTNPHTEGVAPKVLQRMVHKARTNMPEVLNDFHQQSGHALNWRTLNEPALLSDLQGMVELNTGPALEACLALGSGLVAITSPLDKIVPDGLSHACFPDAENRRAVEAQHSELGYNPSRYTSILYPLTCPRI